MSTEATKQQVAQALLLNLYRFNEKVMQGGNEVSQLSPKPHKELCQVVQDWESKRKKLILMPRDTFKSSCVTIAYTIQQVCKNPNIRVLIGSETNAKAKDFLRAIKDTFERNERLRYLYGEHVRYKSRWTDDEITSAQRTVNLKEPTVFTTGTDQTRTGSHCDLAIIDDPVSHTNINTKESREKTLNWYREIANNILDPQGHLIVIGTRWHYSDLYQYILDEELDDYDVVIKSIMNDQAYKILRSTETIEEKEKKITDDMLLFPQRMTVRALWSKLKSSGSSMFSNQHMNKVITEEDADFKEKDIQYYDISDPNFQPKIRELNVYMSIDPAISEKESADDTSIICVGVDKDGHWYVLEYDNGHFKPQETIDRTFAMYQRHPHTRKIGLEVVAWQKGLYHSFREEMLARGQKIPLVELKRDNREGKEMRIKTILQPIVEQKRLFLQPGMIELVEQIKEFPRAKHDDIIDSLADISQLIVGYKKLGNRSKLKESRAELDDRMFRRRPLHLGLTRTRFVKY